MKERERIVVAEMTALMVLLWLGFYFHRSPRFPGSLMGGVLGITGAFLMLAPLLYLIIKRIPWLKARVSKHVSMRTLLSWHIYAGLTGPILGLLHTGHKFDSRQGIALTTVMMVVALSGFIGRYLFQRASEDRAEKQNMLEKLQGAYQAATTEIQEGYGASRKVSEISAVALAETMADVEYAMKTADVFKRMFWLWLKVHIAIAGLLYVLLALHIWSGIYFGLRWFPLGRPGGGL